MSRSDHCEQCSRTIRFTASKAEDLPGLEFCSPPCVDRFRRDLAVVRANIDGATVAEIGARFDLRREKVTQILAAHRARVDRLRDATHTRSDAR